jgi:hypothetical protein
MFAEMLTNSEEKIFLEAIDQYLEDESFEQMNIKTRKILFEDSNIKEEKEMESQVDKDKEADIEIMNIKFYEALNIDSNEIKDISTDFESEDNNLTNEKSFIKLSDCLILTKEFIENNKQKIFNEYKNQIILEEKIKNLFKKDEVNEKDVKNSDLNNEK